MLSKSKVKQIRSLELKKFRNETNTFVAEGNKLVADMLHAFECDLLIAKPSWMATQGDIPAKELLEADDDDIQDPGNLGTIIRLADWFGIEHIVCSQDTADAFSPKTVQATMGALVHVQVHYTDLHAYLQKQAEQQVPLYGTFLDGENIYAKELSETGIIIMGNEGNGIRPETETLVNEKLYIPNYPQERETSESLNVAIATAVVCAEFRRRRGNTG